MAVDYSNEPVHVGVYAEQRRGTVLLCDHDRVLPHWLTITTGELGPVTCHACLHLVQEGEASLAAMQRIRDRSQMERDAFDPHVTRNMEEDVFKQRDDTAG